MSDFLQHRPAWYVLGPLIGLIVVGLLWTIDERIGVVGGYSNLVERATGRASGLDWRAWFLFGVLGGGLLFRLASGSSTVQGGYGWLTREFSDPVTAIALLVGGGLIGYGAKTAGGCTSGNGLGGCSLGSPASFSATATFMGTAIVASFAIKGLT